MWDVVYTFTSEQNNMAYNLKYLPKNNCKFKDCINYKKIGCGGYCETHKKQDPGFERKEQKSVLKKQLSKIKILINSSDNKLIENIAGKEFQLLQNWFREVWLEIDKNPVCWECKKKIPPAYYRAATAHILSKKIFKSVATHPMNYLILCASNGCHEQTHRLDTFSKMGIFPEAVRRFRIIYPDVKEKNKILNTFLEYANSI